MKKFLLFYFAVILTALLLGSCSPKQQARKLVRQAYAKLEKARRLDPTVIDSVKGVTELSIFVPGDSGTVAFQPEGDSVLFEWVMDDYDKDLLAVDSLNRLLKEGNLTKRGMEKTLADQARLIESLKATRDQIKRGFAKDSVYHHEDSLIAMDIAFKGGQFNAVDYMIKDRTLTTKVDTVSINMDGRPLTQPWKQSWFWIMLCLILALLLVILVMLKR